MKEGDEVLAADAESGKPIIAKVAKAYAREVGMVIDIEVEGETIEATANHPFWVEGEGWVEAEGLQEGSRLVTKEGKAVCVESIHRREGLFKVYNLEVSGAHNYFVGRLSVLVHNQTTCPAPELPFNTNKPGAGGYGVNNLPKDPNDLVTAGWKEITDPRMAANSNRRVFQDPSTGLTVNFDRGVLGANGFRGMDHYSVPNPNSTSKINFYLDANGNPVPKGSKGSHIVP